MRGVDFCGSSLRDLRGFPKDVQQDMGYQIYRVQCGFDPNDWRAMPTVGTGVRELRVRGSDSQYRAIYVTTIGDTVHVLHVFVKKSQRTPKTDIEIAMNRLSEIRRKRQM